MFSFSSRLITAKMKHFSTVLSVQNQYPIVPQIRNKFIDYMFHPEIHIRVLKISIDLWFFRVSPDAKISLIFLGCKMCFIF